MLAPLFFGTPPKSSLQTNFHAAAQIATVLLGRTFCARQRQQGQTIITRDMPARRIFAREQAGLPREQARLSREQVRDFRDFWKKIGPPARTRKRVFFDPPQNDDPGGLFGAPPAWARLDLLAHSDH